MLWEDLLQRPFCIYGAGIVATSVYTAFRTLYNRIPLFFLVSDAVVLSIESEPNTKSEKKQVYDQAGFHGNNPSQIDGIPIKTFPEWEREDCKNKRQNPEAAGDKFDKENPEIYIVAVPGTHHAAILEMLKKLSVREENIYLITNKLENDLMEELYSSLPGCDTVRNILGRERRQNCHVQGDSLTGSESQINVDRLVDFECQIDVDNRTVSESQANADSLTSSGSPVNFSSQAEVHVYQAKSHKDRPLRKKRSALALPSYIDPIQVGTVLTEQRIAELRDNIGDNISAKNSNYCELTATYYAWKHSTAPYKGLCHYRRFFDISDEQMQALLEAGNEWDVILPYPSVHYPNISAQHFRYLSEADWSAMLQALEELEPEYLKAYEESVASGEHFFHNFNMLIAKAVVFDDYCRFLFRILERTEELVTPKGWERADRFAGYMGENLTTIYFLKNRDRWKQVYAGKIWLV